MNFQNMTISELLQRAAQYHRAGQLQEAERLYRDILQAQPNQPIANHNLGVLKMLSGQAVLAVPYLHNAWINSYNEQFCVTLTECLLTLDRSSDALQILNNAVQKKGFKSTQVIRLLQLAGSVVGGAHPAPSVLREVSALREAGHHAVLEERLKQLLNQFPNWGFGWDMLCTTLQIQSKDGEDALQRALQFMPYNSNVHAQKIFCIGANKTGTTSVQKVFDSLGLAVGNQWMAEMFIHDWAKRDYRRIVRYCQSAQAFQDVPFGYMDTFQAMDHAFPCSKFILTVRDNADEWYESLVRFHSALVGKGRIPTAEDLRQFLYQYPGFLLDALKLVFGVDEENLYDREVYIRWYEEHNSQVIEYFAGRPNDLLVLNIADADAMERLLVFLGYPYTGQKMPHLNSSK